MAAGMAGAWLIVNLFNIAKQAANQMCQAPSPLRIKVKMFGSEQQVCGHVDVVAARQRVIQQATAEFDAFCNVNPSIQILDVTTFNSTNTAGPHGGWNPLACCVITVKYTSSSD